MFIFERESVHATGGGAERERETEGLSGLGSDNREPSEGLELMNPLN